MRFEVPSLVTCMVRAYLAADC